MVDVQALFQDVVQHIPSWVNRHNVLLAFYLIMAWEFGKVVLGVFWKYNPLRCSHNLSRRYGKCWAVVTGASSGIGYGYAIALAKRGFNVILVARRKDRLEVLRKEVEALGVEALVLERDLSDATPQAIKKLVADMGQRDIGVLVANAGISEIAYHFSDRSLERNTEMVHLNCLSLVLLMQELLPKLVNRPTGLRSGVVTLGALNARIPMPQFALSAGTKAFIRQFSMVAGKTLDGSVDVLCAHPFAVQSEIVKVDAKSCMGRLWTISTPEQFCEGTLRHLGRNRETFGNWLHEFVHDLWLAITPDEVNMGMNYSMINIYNGLLKRDLHDADLRKKLTDGEYQALRVPA